MIQRARIGAAGAGRRISRLALAAGLLAAVAAPAEAQRLNLTILPRTISFPSSDPDVVPVVSSGPLQILYRVRQNGGRPWTLTVLANGDLISGGATVDISNVSWVATPAPPFQNGTLSKTVAQQVASGNGNVNPARLGQVTFRLVNAWTYSAGVYTQTIVFTLSAP
jgi:hypothetical protein